MPHSPAVRLLVLSILTTAFAATALAQKDMGNIVGLVKDSTGAVVAGAKVTITDADRGTSVETTTDVQGAYVAGPLKIGRYSVTVEKQGFKKAVAGPLELNVQDRLAVDVTLQVGTVSETMTITTEGPQLETETSELGQVVNGQTATALPLNGRNFAQLAQIAAGVAPNEPGARTETTFGFSSNGARALENNFLLDGVDNNAYLGDVLNFSAYVIQPSIDAIGEFKVETNSYSAEFGRGNGAIMNAVIKSGTNRFHGEALEFIRNDKFDGKNAFDLFGRRQYQQNQFGANLGGPIIKGRTFFFADYEGLRIRQALPTLALIPTPQQLSGNFSSFLNLSSQIAGVVDCSGNPTFTGEMFNPRLTQAFAGNPTGFCGVPIAVNGTGVPTNMFPATGPSAIATPAANLAALFPAPNISFEGNNFLVDPKKSLNQNNFDIRIDHRFTDKDNFFARFSYEDQPLFVPGPFTTVLDGGGFVAGHQDNSYRSVAISELHTFTPNLLNEVRLGYSRVNSQRSEPNANTNVAAQIGIPGVPFTPGFGGLPSMCFFDYACIGTNDFLPAIEKQNSFVINENLTWTHGRHSVKFGTELRREEFTILEDSAPRGDMTFTPDFSGNPGAPMGTAPGDDIASFLLGVPDAADIVNVHGPDYRRNIAAFFAQDDFRATNRLTLNLGIRYDLYRPITEGKNQQATFDFRSDTLFVPKGTTTPLTPTIASFLPISATAPPGLVPPMDTNFSPRIGFAYQLTEKLVLRGGYGIFYGGTESGPFSFPSPGFSPPFFRSQTFSSLCGSAGALPAIANPALGNANCAVGVKPGTGGGPPDTTLMINDMWTGGYPATSLSDPNNPPLFSLQPNLKNPMMQQWHLGMEYQLPHETVVKISYAGSHGEDLYGFYNGNQAALAPPACDVPTPPPSCSLDARRPFPGVNGTISTFRSNTISNYNSLQAHVEKRASHGLTFDASYTYSHSLDDASSASLGSLNNADFRNQADPGLEYGNSDFDVRQHMVVGYSWELPLGRGQAVGGDASGFLNGVIGNWQVSGIVSASSGNWFTVSDTTTNDTNVDCGGTVAFNCSRPNVVGNPNGKPCVAGTFFNTCAFASNTTPNTFGDEGRNSVRGPGYQTWDMSILKTFPMNEGMRFEFRADFFNMWNHTNPLWAPFGAAGQVAPTAIEIGTAQFGHFQAAKDPRFIQFALKFYF